MSTTIRDATTNTGAGTAASVSAPAGTTPGDVVICVLCVNGVDATSDNNGGSSFTKDLDDLEEGLGGITMSIWSRRIQAGDPSTYNFTLETSQRWTLHAIALQSPHPSVIYDVAIGTNHNVASGVTSINAPSITTINANAIHFAVAGADGASSTFSATPSGYTVHENSGQQVAAVCSIVIASPGATGAQTFSISSTQSANGVSFAIRDDGAGGSLIAEPRAMRAHLVR